MTTWANVDKSNAGIAQVDFLFSDGLDFLFSDGSDYVFSEGSGSIVWTAPSKNTPTWSQATKNNPSWATLNKA